MGVGCGGVGRGLAVGVGDGATCVLIAGNPRDTGGCGVSGKGRALGAAADVVVPSAGWIGLGVWGNGLGAGRTAKGGCV